MPFIPHTEADVAAMLASIGASSLDALFDEIPDALRCGELDGVPVGMNEMQVTRLMQERAAQDMQSKTHAPLLNFIGAGAYEHHIPAAVWQLVTRGEFYTAYTPYQAEASQGTLQLLYEYQTMMASLTGMDVSNASLYDGASGLAEAILMAVRAHKTSRRVLMPATVAPIWRDVARNIVQLQNIELVTLDFDIASGKTDFAALQKQADEDIAALVIPQPNFFGALEDVDALTDWAHAHGALAVALVNPLSLALLKAPGRWGAKGADIAVGDGQPLGAPLSSGGPHFGFICCKDALVRQMPGRIIGRTVDLEGKAGYTLTLQAREQHIRRAKATSNICSNQGLMVAAATIHMALLGADGLRRAAAASHANTAALAAQIQGATSVRRFFGAHFHEIVLQLSKPVAAVLDAMREQDVLGGYDLSARYPQLGHAMLVCATETKTADDLQRYVNALQRAL
ncbi:MAG: aminomethyl-transferring glycine dehydrogenase subunit GcvPA [Gallionellaceae bacterium]|jgi:glycine dehydrogenase subunit 1|nr:aminomethyl-transferring glycine dehydrogenase subunit GcvPA [Gallionellaceae bacterium]